MRAIGGKSAIRGLQQLLLASVMSSVVASAAFASGPVQLLPGADPQPEIRVEPSSAKPFTFSFSNEPDFDLPAYEPYEEQVEPLPDPGPGPVVHSDAPDERFGSGLNQALAHYRAIAMLGGWDAIEGGDTIEPGMSDPRVPALRRRLALSGDLPRSYASRSNVYDSGLEMAVRHFQERHGLTIDGLVGPATLGAMNVSVEERIRQIEVNMVRWQQSAPELGQRYVLVNIPSFTLEVIENNSTVLRMGVVTGKPSHRTPVFSDRIEYIEFNPYWNVPRSITRNELIDQFAQNPASAQGFEVIYKGEAYDASRINWHAVGTDSVPFRIRQTPGPRNALGQVKFMFPNHHNVYLHDTPAQHLFARASRAFSHGCVRVERPRDFARYLLGSDPDWSPARVDAALDGGRNMQVPLLTPVPVHIVYMTAWVDRQGTVQFRDDIYGKDDSVAVTASVE